MWKVSDQLKDRHPYIDRNVINPKEIAVSFGREAIPRLLDLSRNPDMTAEELVQCVHEFNLVLSHQETKIEALNCNAVTAMLHLLGHQSAGVRAKALAVLTSLGVIPQGVEEIERNDGVEQITALLHESESTVRLQASAALRNISNSNGGGHVLVARDCVAPLVTSLVDTSAAVIDNALQSLYNITRFDDGQESIIAANAGPVLLKLCRVAKHKHSAVECLWNISRHANGKVALVKDGAVAVVSELLIDESDDVRRIAAGTILLLCVDIDAKKQATETALKHLYALQKGDDEDIRTNASLALKMICEWPAAQELLAKLQAAG
eukprot:TRINITY_DN10005_c0_g1_i1.p1 TRINITY_DN10005_c0_g1~~TRINITY_DN10005_c0_g1_i1.p1  ORF type:complete len:322 (-),score=61.71 TRINITY_DN10005_c0_g1_i1:156-1121(-)